MNLRRLAAVTAAVLVAAAVLAGGPLSRPAAAAACPSSWTQMKSQDTSASRVQLDGVAIGASKQGWAVGHSTQASHQVSLIEHGTPSGWTIVSSPTITGYDTDLDAVAVDPSGGAWAVGYTSTRQMGVLGTHYPFIEHWDPTAKVWSIAYEGQSVGQPGTLVSVAVAPTGAGSFDVWAVGYAPAAGGDQTLVMEAGPAGAFSVVSSGALNRAGSQNRLLGVAVDGSGTVWTAGYSMQGAAYRTLVGGWPTGNPGTMQLADSSALDLVQAQQVVLDSIAVDGSGDLWTVGYWSDGRADHPLIGESGPPGSGGPRTFTAMTGAEQGSVENILRSVSYDAATGQIWAVGSTYLYEPAASPPVSTYRTLAEYWSPTTGAWTLSTTPATGLELRTIAPAPGTPALVAVGYSQQASRYRTLVDVACPSAAGAASGALPTPGAPAGAPARPAPPAAAPATVRTTSPPELVVSSDQAAAAGISNTTMTPTFAAAVADVNGDGYPDFLISRIGSAPAQLYMNIPNAAPPPSRAFSLVDQGLFPPGLDRKQCVFGDVNPGAPDDAGPSGGLPDLFCAIGAWEGTSVKANEMWIQQPYAPGSAVPTFVNESPAYATENPYGGDRVAALFDANGDGFPDLFVGGSTQRGDGMPLADHFYLNLGATSGNPDAGFVDDPAAGLDQSVFTSCAKAADYHSTTGSFPDLLLCTSNGLQLWDNCWDPSQQGAQAPCGTQQSGFVNVTASLPAQAVSNVQDALFVDVNGDGLPDLVVLHPTALEVYAQSSTSPGTFALAYRRPLVAAQAIAAGDVNGDGLPDLFVVQVGVPSSGAPNLMLVNDGTGTGFDSIPVPEPATGAGQSVWPIDYDGDGLMDFLVLNGNNRPGPVQLVTFRPNPSPDPLTVTANLTNPAVPSFSFVTTDTSATYTFLCSLDGADPTPCGTSPSGQWTYSGSGLASGQHQFAVWTVDAAGNSTAEAATTWTVSSAVGSPARGKAEP